MNLLWIIVIVLVVMAIMGAPGGAFTHQYGYWPSGGLGLLVLILIILLLLGKL